MMVETIATIASAATISDMICQRVMVLLLLVSQSSDRPADLVHLLDLHCYGPFGAGACFGTRLM